MNGPKRVFKNRDGPFLLHIFDERAQSCPRALEMLHRHDQTPIEGRTADAEQIQFEAAHGRETNPRTGPASVSLPAMT